MYVWGAREKSPFPPQPLSVTMIPTHDHQSSLIIIINHHQSSS
jgi:hypothetical protein